MDDDKPKEKTIRDIDTPMLRAQADAGYIPLSVYIEEMQRRVREEGEIIPDR